MHVDQRMHKIMIMIVSKGIFAPPSQNLSASVAAMRGLYLIVLSSYGMDEILDMHRESIGGGKSGENCQLITGRRLGEERQAQLHEFGKTAELRG